MKEPGCGPHVGQRSGVRVVWKRRPRVLAEVQPIGETTGVGADIDRRPVIATAVTIDAPPEGVPLIEIA